MSTFALLLHMGIELDVAEPPPEARPCPSEPGEPRLARPAVVTDLVPASSPKPSDTVLQAHPPTRASGGPDSTADDVDSLA